MKTWIALLRGINVGGKNALPMKDLRAMLEGLGLKNVRTYIQSGNCVFDSGESDADMLAATIADSIEKAFGFRVQVLVIAGGDFDAALAECPYPEGADDPKSVHLFFLSERPEDPDVDSIEKIKAPSERYSLSDRVLYLYAPDGIARSKLAAQVEKHLGVSATARNYRSATKIAELAR